MTAPTPRPLARTEVAMFDSFLDDDWLELAGLLETLAETIREAVDDDHRNVSTTRRLARAFGDEPTKALIAAAMACGVTEHRR